jgi:transposase
MMLKIIFYSYYKGIKSCRNIWDALKYRADYIYLSGDQVPDFKTVNELRKRHLNELPFIFFPQIVVLCETLDLLGFDHLAIDGQKIH